MTVTDDDIRDYIARIYDVDPNEDVRELNGYWRVWCPTERYWQRQGTRREMVAEIKERSQ